MKVCRLSEVSVMVFLVVKDAASNKPIANVDVLAVNMEGEFHRTTSTSEEGTVSPASSVIPVFVFLAKEGYEPRWLGPLENDYRNEKVLMLRTTDGSGSQNFTSNEIQIPGFSHSFTIYGSERARLPPTPSGHTLHEVYRHIGHMNGASSVHLQVREMDEPDFYVEEPREIIAEVGEEFQIWEKEKNLWAYVTVIARIGTCTLIKYQISKNEEKDAGSFGPITIEGHGTVSDPPPSPEITVPAGDLGIEGHSPKAKTTSVAAIGRSLIQHRRVLLEELPGLQETAKTVLEHYEKNIPNDPETLTFVEKLQDLSDGLQQLYIHLESEPTEEEAGEKGASLCQNLIVALEALEKTKTGDKLSRLSTSALLLGVAAIFSPEIVTLLALPIMTVCVFPQETGKLGKLLKILKDYIR